MRSLRNIRVSQSKAEWSDRNRYQPIGGRVCQVLKNSVIHNHESLQQWDKGYCTYAWTPKLVIYNSMSDIQWYSQRRGFEVRIWLPLYWSPVDSKLLVVIRSWWIPWHIQSRQTAIRYYFRLAGLRGGGGGRLNKGTPEDQEVRTLRLFEPPSHGLFGLNLMANPFWFDCTKERINNPNKMGK